MSFVTSKLVAREIYFLAKIAKLIANRVYRKIPKISPSKYKPPKLVRKKTLR